MLIIYLSTELSWDKRLHVQNFCTVKFLCENSRNFKLVIYDANH